MKKKDSKYIDAEEISGVDPTDTSDMDSDTWKLYVVSAVISGVLTGINLWTLIRFNFKGSGTFMVLIACIVVCFSVTAVMIAMYKKREKSKNYLNIVPCLHFTNLYNWIMVAAPLALVIVSFVELGFNVRMRGLTKIFHFGVLALGYVICAIAGKHASKAYNKEEPLHAMLSTYSNDNHMLGWATAVGLAAAIVTIILTSKWFLS